MEYQIEEIKKMVKEDLTDAEAKDLLQKMEKSREAEMAGKPYMTFDWAKAIMLIFAYNIQNAEFGLREDWEEVKDNVMRKAVYAKFSQNIELKNILLDTDSEYIVENTSNDYYWGCGINGSGKNMLGIILMEIRDKLKLL